MVYTDIKKSKEPEREAQLVDYSTMMTFIHALVESKGSIAKEQALGYLG